MVFPGARTIGNWETPEMGERNKVWESTKCFKPLSHLYSPSEGISLDGSVSQSVVIVSLTEFRVA